MKDLTPESIYQEYQAGIDFNSQLNLVNNVDNNENFYIGKQWEGVQSNGLPTPTFNFIKRIVNFQISSTSTDNLKIYASPIPSSGVAPMEEVEQVCNVLNAQFAAIWEHTSAARKTREFMRDAAVRSDGCLYSWFDPDMDIGDGNKGGIRLEVLENTRVFFGNPTDRNIQTQPYLIVEKRVLLEDARRLAKDFGGDPDLIQPDTDSTNNRFDQMSGNKTTLLYRFARDLEGGTIHASISARDCWVRKRWDTGQTLYPIVWMSWDHVPSCYHGMGLVDGLIPNQVFVNRMFAMVYLSLMTTAYPKIIYDKTRIKAWNGAVGAAIGVNGGDINSVAKTMDPATISPQVSQFIQLTVDMTKDLMGATDAALGSTRPDNTSAIIALQKASTIPTEVVKQNFFQCVEDMARIWADLMRTYYGTRAVGMTRRETELGIVEEKELFDFSSLDSNPIYIKLDVGGSAYWSEIAQIQTLDNLLMQGKISTSEYVRRLPSGYINMQQELVAVLEQEEAFQRQVALGANNPVPSPSGTTAPIAPQPQQPEPTGGPGYGALQRQINEEAAGV